MRFRLKITLGFISMSIVLLGLTSMAIYYLFAQSREDVFYERLSNKALTTAKLLIDVEEVDKDLLQKIEKNTPGSLPYEYIAIINSGNLVIYESDSTHRRPADATLIGRARREGLVFFEEKEGGLEGLAMRYDQVGEDGMVILANAKDLYGKSRLKALRNILGGVFFLGLLASMLAGALFADQMTVPIRRLMNQIHKIGADNLEIRLENQQGKDEVSQLSSAFNGLLDRLERAFAVQRQFIANASHEIRTPLSAVLGNLDVLILKEREKEEYKSTLVRVHAEIRQLHRLFEQLMLLTEAGSEVLTKTFAPVRIDDILWDAHEKWAKKNSNLEISIQFDGHFDTADHLMVHGNPDLLASAIGNLLENAAKYSKPSTANLLVKSQPGGIVIEFTNPVDSPIQPGPEWFEPFFRDPAHKGIPGHGLGLPLSRQIARIHKGDLIMYLPGARQVAFSLFLPTLAGH